MKSLIACLLILLLLSAPCWAQDSEVKRLWPGGGYVEGQFYDSYGNPFRITQEYPVLLTQPPCKPTQYETKAIPEAELEHYLNCGWELVKAYTVEEEIWEPGTTRWYKHGRIVHKAIIRRVK
jgi:hypothetical protein